MTLENVPYPRGPWRSTDVAQVLAWNSGWLWDDQGQIFDENKRFIIRSLEALQRVAVDLRWIVGEVAYVDWDVRVPGDATKRADIVRERVRQMGPQ